MLRHSLGHVTFCFGGDVSPMKSYTTYKSNTQQLFYTLIFLSDASFRLSLSKSLKGYTQYSDRRIAVKGIAA